MHAWAIGIKTASITVRIAREVLLFGDKVHDVEAQSIYAAIGPEFTDFFQLRAQCRVFPVQVSLLRGKEVQIILLAFSVPAPGAATEF